MNQDETAARAAEVYADALELAPPDRAAFLQRACGQDSGLRAAVETLLAHTDECEAFVAGLAGKIGTASLMGAGASQAGQAGQQVGPYRLVERVGAGGMGSVWRAERNDGQYQGQVAVKLLQRSYLSGDHATQLQREAQHLAKLSHPNIARMFDAGIDDSHHPYLILELVDGTSIADYCDGHCLGLRRRIELFLDVLIAVAHAHSHLIVHHDIKPSNVLVTREGQVKLLDFGISRLQGGQPQSAGERSADERPAGTPEYAAPEQLAGAPTTTTADVYSLGMLLSQLLIGSCPRDLRDVRSVADLITAAQQPLPNASTLFAGVTPERAMCLAELRGTTPEKMRQALAGELDQVLRKALEPDPHNRYATAREFASDLGRLLRNEPVQAMAPTRRYLARKFVARNSHAVAAAALVLTALVAATAITTWQMFEARQQRNVALYQQQRVQAANEFYGLLLEEVNASGEPFTPVELLDRATALIDAQYGADVDFIGRPYFDVIRRYRSIGERATAELKLAKAIELATRQGDLDLLAALNCSGAMDGLQIDPETTRARILSGVAHLQRSTGASLDDRYQCWAAEALLQRTDGNLDEATRLLERTAGVLRSSPVASVSSLTETLSYLGALYYAQSRFDDMLEVNFEAERINRANGRDNTFHQLAVLNDRSAVLSTLGEYATALEIRKDVDRRIRSLAPTGRGQFEATRATAVLLMQMSRFDEAVQLLEEARKGLAAGENQLLNARLDLAFSRTYARMGDAERARPHLERAESGLLNAQRAVRDNLQRARIEYAIAGGELQVAESLIEDLLTAIGYPEDTGAVGLSPTLELAIRVALATGRLADAERMANDKLQADLRAARSPTSSANVGRALYLRARSGLAMGRADEARRDLQEAIEPLSVGLGTDNPETREAHRLLGRIQAR